MHTGPSRSNILWCNSQHLCMGHSGVAPWAAENPAVGCHLSAPSLLHCSRSADWQIGLGKACREETHDAHISLKENNVI